jgi:hypothetical protein
LRENNVSRIDFFRINKLFLDCNMSYLVGLVKSNYSACFDVLLEEDAQADIEQSAGAFRSNARA